MPFDYTRCLVSREIPLNQGCLTPITIVVPQFSILSPSEMAAVVGGNVLTSQRVTDVILEAFGACANSQVASKKSFCFFFLSFLFNLIEICQNRQTNLLKGCMNNLTFGNETIGYYETIAGIKTNLKIFSIGRFQFKKINIFKVVRELGRGLMGLPGFKCI